MLFVKYSPLSLSLQAPIAAAPRMNALNDAKPPETMLHITVLFYGNAADHRGAWDAATLRQGFRHKDGVSTMSSYPNGIFVRAIGDKLPTVVASFVGHVRQKVLAGLGGYDAIIRSHLAPDPCSVVPSMANFTLSIRAYYGHRHEFKIRVLAPPSVRAMDRFDFLFDMMETVEHWDVNSINMYGYSDGVLIFTAVEADAARLVRLFRVLITDEIRYARVDDEIMDVPYREYRRGRSYFMQYGITTSSGTEWGPAPFCVPVQPGYETIDAVEDKCAICLTDLDQNLARTACGHIFHLGCMNKLWDHALDKCPLCRSKIESVRRVRMMPSAVVRSRTRSQTESDRVQKRRRVEGHGN